MIEDNYKLLASWIKQESSLLDLGCGSGDLLKLFVERLNIKGIGVEIDEKLLSECINKSVQVAQVDIEKGLDIFKDNSFDYVVLSYTLQEMRDPKQVLNEMLRIGKQAIVLIDNAGHISNRLGFLFGNTPSNARNNDEVIRRMITINDFENMCETLDLHIVNKSYLTSAGATALPLLSKRAAFLLQRKQLAFNF